MRVAVIRLATLLAAVAGLPLIGCDSASHQADKEAQARIDEAMHNRRMGGEQGNTAAKQALQAAVASADISNGTKIHAKSMLAQVNVEAATDLMRRIDQEEQALADVAFELSQLAVQLDAGAILVTDYSKYDPKAAREQIQAKIAEAQGGPDKAEWFTHEKSVIPTQAALKQKISELQTELATLQNGAKTLEEQRTSLMQQAQTAMAAAEEAKGADGLAQFRDASAIQRKASEVHIQLDQTNAKMIPIQSQLAVAEAQQHVLDDVIKQLQAQSDALEAGWRSMQEQMNSQVQLARQIVGSDGGITSLPPTTGPSLSPPTIAGKAALINAKAGAIRAMRTEAQADLEEAAKLFDEARRAAEDLRSTTEQRLGQITIPDHPEKKSWDSLKEVLNAQYYQFRAASAKRMLGALFASDAASINNRMNLQSAVAPVIDRAGASAPADLRPGDLARQLKEASAQAEEAYKSANELLANVTEGATPDKVKNAATVEKILVLYGLAQVEKLNGDAAAAKGHIDEAIALRNNAVEQNIHVPAMPAELGPPPLPPGAVEPTTEPTTAPSGEPSGEAATEPSTNGENDQAAPAAPATTEGATPPADGATPPADGATPPADGATPPATQPDGGGH